MIYPMIFVSLFLLSGCSAFSKPTQTSCISLVKEARRAGCQLHGVVRDSYLEKCAVACK